MTEIERICLAALDRPADERAAFLEDACHGDAALRQEIESLLAHASPAEQFIEHPAVAGPGALAGLSGLSLGQRLGPYHIVAKLGAGGMGEVYRARDTQLGREVAIKILPVVFATDPERLARFEREARVLASLNHPHIAAIYGLEARPPESGPQTRALVMELVEGHTLADRIADGPLRTADALTIARQIAEALEAAHDKGIVHRDLKPANIKVTPDGVVKVLDFGLAKTVSSDSGTSPTFSPTITATATRHGVLLGTAAYMSPEQAGGRHVDKRADIWAFGCVLYEMLTGRRPFEGAGVTEVLGAVLKTDPDWDAVPPDLSPAIRVFLRRCFEKDVRRRIQDIGDVRLALDGAFDLPPAAGPSRWTGPRALAAAAILVVLGMSAGVFFESRTTSRDGAPPGRQLRLQVATPPDADPVDFALAPDGASLVFIAPVKGARQLWLRAFDTEDSRPLGDGTDGAQFPFWSPDSRAVGFFARQSLKRIDLDSGIVRTIADAANARRGAWGADGTIVFGATTGPLMRVAATNGSVTSATTLLPGQVNHRWSQFVPGTNDLLFLALGTADVRGLYRSSLGGMPRRLMTADSQLGLISPPYALLAREESLWAQPFSNNYEMPQGDGIAVAPHVLRDVGTTGLVAFSSSPTGAFAYRPAGDTRQLVWFDRTGRQIAAVGTPDSSQMGTRSLSRDGSLALFDRAVDGNTDVWVMDTKRGVWLRRLTFDPSIDQVGVLSPDASRTVFGSDRISGFQDLYVTPTDGGGAATLLLESAVNKNAEDWSGDGKFILYNTQNAATDFDLWALPMIDEPKSIPVATSRYTEYQGRFSPDGHWIAFVSNETGRLELYLQPFPGSGPKVQVSTGGGQRPQWRADGRELFFRSPDSKLMSVSLDPGVPLTSQVFDPRPLFNLPENLTDRLVVSGDGQRFLFIRRTAPAPPINVVLNWRPKH